MAVDWLNFPQRHSMVNSTAATILNGYIGCLSSMSPGLNPWVIHTCEHPNRFDLGGSEAQKSSISSPAEHIQTTPGKVL
jgi:hypothetical protein